MVVSRPEGHALGMEGLGRLRGWGGGRVRDPPFQPAGAGILLTLTVSSTKYKTLSECLLSVMGCETQSWPGCLRKSWVHFHSKKDKKKRHRAGDKTLLSVLRR